MSKKNTSWKAKQAKQQQKRREIEGLTEEQLVKEGISKVLEYNAGQRRGFDKKLTEERSELSKRDDHMKILKDFKKLDIYSYGFPCYLFKMINNMHYALVILNLFTEYDIITLIMNIFARIVSGYHSNYPIYTTLTIAEYSTSTCPIPHRKFEVNSEDYPLWYVYRIVRYMHGYIVDKIQKGKWKRNSIVGGWKYVVPQGQNVYVGVNGHKIKNRKNVSEIFVRGECMSVHCYDGILDVDSIGAYISLMSNGI